MYVIVPCDVRLTPSKQDLKTQASIGQRRDSYRHRMQKLTVILLVIACVFSPHPAFEVRNTALKKRHDLLYAATALHLLDRTAAGIALLLHAGSTAHTHLLDRTAALHLLRDCTALCVAFFSFSS